MDNRLMRTHRIRVFIVGARMTDTLAISRNLELFPGIRRNRLMHTCHPILDVKLVFLVPIMCIYSLRRDYTISPTGPTS